ncbi:hypothetical protein AB0N05_35890 [Nocardia sp. NPDC051030]|uniref:hypothetical protein n=1 Tax=Nocardia sp. NPDC051030 TaxID=3155162 RepID=UPI00341245BB
MTAEFVTPVTRAVRAAIFAMVAVALAAAGHARVSGHELSFSALLLAFAGTAAVTWALADRQWGVFALVGGLAGLQLVLHLWFGLAPMASGHGGHGMPKTDDALNSPSMAGAHCLAALICGLWLWFGELALFSLLRALYARVFVPLLLVYLHPSTSAGVTGEFVIEHRILQPAETLLRHVLARRGPPASASTV